MDVVIIGAGGHGKVVLDILRAASNSKIRPIGFLDADPALVGSSINDLPVLGRIHHVSKLKQQKVTGAIVAIGDNRTRFSYAQYLIDEGVDLISAIHPRAIVSSTARTGRNVVIAAGAVVCADAQVGDSVILNTGCIVDHECEIGEAAHICPGVALAGRVRIGAGRVRRSWRTSDSVPHGWRTCHHRRRRGRDRRHTRQRHRRRGAGESHENFRFARGLISLPT